MRWLGELTRLLEADGPERAHGAFVEAVRLRAARRRGSDGAGGSTAALGVQVAQSVYGAMMPVDGAQRGGGKGRRLLIQRPRHHERVTSDGTMSHW
jgi:hypothetical protein